MNNIQIVSLVIGISGIIGVITLPFWYEYYQEWQHKRSVRFWNKVREIQGIPQEKLKLGLSQEKK